MKKYYNSKKQRSKRPHGMQGHNSPKKHRAASKRPQVHKRIAAGSSFASLGTVYEPETNLADSLLDFLRRRGNQRTTVDRIASELRVTNLSELYAVLNELDEKGEIAFAPNGMVKLVDERAFVRGSFRGNRRGFGFVTPEGKTEREEDIFIPLDYVGDAIDGDAVVCELIGAARHGELHGDSRPEGRIARVVEHTRKTIIGTLGEMNVGSRKKIRRVPTVTPDDERLSFKIIATVADGVECKNGDKVEVTLERYPSNGFAARGLITACLGESGSREANYEAILRENGIRREFPEEVIDEAQRVSAVTPRMTKSRLDLRDREIFTIDGADAKDLDDAVSLEKTKDGWLLGVHIADVSHYVRPGSALDDEAIMRGTSVYFTDKVVPMLPRELSNGICSLNAGVQRYTLSALISLDKNGAIKDVELAESLIKSKVRGVYSEVNDVFKKGARSEFAKKYEPVSASLKLMKQLYEILKKRSEARGALELETAEAAIILDENGEPCDIIRRERGDAEKMIEQFMLCANEAVANHLYSSALPCVYRIHEDPNPEKLSAFIEFAYNLGLPVQALKNNPSPATLGAVIAAASERGIGSTVSGVALRSLAKAKYSSSPARHFGLGIDKYCHFTSPIRRYPDLATHRIIKNALHARLEGTKLEAWKGFAAKAAELSSENELRAIAAERGIEDLYKCIYMSSRVGNEYDGVISSVNSFGFFVELENTCEGLVSITDLDGWYEYDEKRMTLSKGAKVFSLGMPVRVRVDKADVISGKVDFSLADERYN